MTAQAKSAQPEVFTRKASGLVRVMSPYSAFIYNILTMGLIFPWTYLWAPGALPGGKLVWGILIAMVIEIPIAFVYVWLSTALPRSGGDYVFQSRVFGGGLAFTIVMSGFVIWILQWVALSGWLVSYLGFAPLFLGLGATLNIPSLASLGIWFTTPIGIIIVSILGAAIALVLLVSGFKHYVRFQHVMFWGTLLCFATVFVVLFVTPASEFVARLDKFVLAVGGGASFYETAVAAVQKAGINLHPPFSMLATLLIAPIAWTSLQWATYSAEQNGEIKDARSFKSQTFVMVGSLIATGLLLALLAVGIERVAPPEFLTVAGAGYWNGVAASNITVGGYGFNLWPPLIAIALTGSPIVVVIIALGLFAQWLSNLLQLLYRHDPHHGRHVAGPPAARVVQQSGREIPYTGERPHRVLHRQHPSDRGLQSRHPALHLDSPDSWRDLWLWLCIHLHLSGGRLATLSRQGGLRRFARCEISSQWLCRSALHAHRRGGIHLDLVDHGPAGL